METVVLSIGGSLISNMQGIDLDYVKLFRDSLIQYMKKKRFVMTVGGGSISRQYQKAADAYAADSAAKDWIGIYGTYLNASLVCASFGGYAYARILFDPTRVPKTKRKAIVYAGWKPGFSTDYDAARLAIALGCRTIINLSDIDYVYDRDPKTSLDARPIKRMSWKEYAVLAGRWEPGKNMPFDPVAARLAMKNGLRVVIMNGRKLQNFRDFLDGKAFFGTTVE